MLSTYFEKVGEQLQTILEKERENMEQAAQKIATAIQNGGIIQLFGCGHSHILTEEVFYRAGGLVPVKPILVEPLMLHEGAMRSSQLERRHDYAQTFMEDVDIQENDVFIVISTSGRNPVPIDVAKFAKEKGAYVIGITSLTYSQSQPSRHKSGKYLFEVVDLVIDNYCVTGDAILQYEKVKVPFAPTSTVAGATILNSIFAEAIRMMADTGLEPPIFLSGNLEGADEHNQALVEKYSKRIPLLTKNLD